MEGEATLEKQYSVCFFSSFLENLQNLCRNYLVFSQFVEVSGYICVGMDNAKEERYVLGELLQSNGKVISDSFCNKVFTMSQTSRHGSTQDAVPVRSDLLNPRVWEGMSQRKRPFESGMAPMASGTHTKDQFSSSMNRKPAMCDTGKPASLEQQFFGSEDTTFQQKKRLKSVDRMVRQSVSLVELPYGPSSIPGNPGMSSRGASAEVGKQFHHAHSAFVNSNVPTQGSMPVLNASNQEQRVLHSSQHYVALGETSVIIPNADTNVFKTEPESCADDDDEEVIDLDGDMIEDYLFQGQGHSRDEGVVCTELPECFQPSESYHPTKNPGTIKVIKFAIKQITMFHRERYGENIDLPSAEPQQLNKLLLDYFREHRKQNGEAPSPASLRTLQISLSSYLKAEGYPYNITKDPEFITSNMYIKQKCDEIQKLKVCKKPLLIDDDDIETMFQKDILGASSAETLTNTMWFVNTKYLCIRGPSEHKTLKWGDIQLKLTEDGREFICRDINANISLKVFANTENPARCFVHCFKQYTSRRPTLVMDNSSPFYLKIIKCPPGPNCLSHEAMPWSCYAKIWRRMVVGAELHPEKKIC